LRAVALLYSKLMIIKYSVLSPYLFFIIFASMRKGLIYFLLLFSVLPCFSQNQVFILSRHVYSYDTHTYLPAADFISDSVKFTIALYDANNDSLYNTPDIDMAIVAPYKADSVYTHIGCQTGLINWQKYVNIKVGKYYYKANCIGATLGKIIISPIPGLKGPPDAMLFDHIPNVCLTLLNGKQDSLKHLLDKNKYTYVLFWGKWCQDCMQSLDKMKALYPTYTNKVTFISMDFSDADTNAVRKLVKEQGYTWPQVVSDEKTNEAFSQTGFPYGILFAPDGSIVKQGMGLKELEQYMSRKK
jgi:thiol-disulfide isomerase/thioredoxin